MDIQTILTREKIEQVFKEFDKSGDGKISSEEIKIMFSKFGKKVTDDEIDNIINHYDCDGDHHLSIDEFKSIFDLHKS